MLRFVLRRLVHALVLVFVTLSATFVVLDIAPGDPLTRYYSPELDPRAMDEVRRQLGLDAPLPVRYVKTIGSFATGDFGVSLYYRRPVSEVLRETVPATLALTIPALVLQLILGFALGVFSAIDPRGVRQRVLTVMALLLYSIPSFYLAFLLIRFFSLDLGWLPAAGTASIEAVGGGLAGASDRVRHMVLPVAALALGSAAVMARFARGSLLDEFREEYVRTARAKGVPEKHIVWRHAMRNAAPQLATVVGLAVPQLLASSAVIEKVFAWPGMGALVVDSIFARDYPVVLATTFFAAVIVVVSNFAADVSHAIADPRIRGAGATGEEA